MQPQDVVSKTATKENCIFSFDFEILCGNLHAGGPQAAYPSVKGVAASIPPAKKWTMTCRAAQNCISFFQTSALRWDMTQRQSLGQRVQALSPVMRCARALSQGKRLGIGRAQQAKMAAPAFFLGRIPPLSAPALCDSSIPARSRTAARHSRGQIC